MIKGIVIKEVVIMQAYSKETGQEVVAELTQKELHTVEIKERKIVIYKLPYMRYGVIEDIPFEPVSK